MYILESMKYSVFRIQQGDGYESIVIINKRVSIL